MIKRFNFDFQILTVNMSLSIIKMNPCIVHTSIELWLKISYAIYFGTHKNLRTIDVITCIHISNVKRVHIKFYIMLLWLFIAATEHRNSAFSTYVVFGYVLFIRITYVLFGLHRFWIDEIIHVCMTLFAWIIFLTLTISSISSN